MSIRSDTIPRSTTRITFILLLFFMSALSVVTQEASAFFGGSHIGVGNITPIPIGYSSSIGVTVKNTGTDWWDYYPGDSRPAWIIKIGNLSWLPNTSYEFAAGIIFPGVKPGEITVDSAPLTPERLPSLEGNYSFQVYTYYPKDFSRSAYLLMDNSPKTVNFTMLPKAPTVSVSTSSLNQKCARGQNASSQSFEVWNSGKGSLTYYITDDVEWLSVSPGDGSSMGEHDVIHLNYDTSGLSPGTYNGTITVAPWDIPGFPQTIAVTLRVSSVGMPWLQLLLE